MAARLGRVFSGKAPHPSHRGQPFREYLEKWLIIAAPIGLFTGFVVVILDLVIRGILLGSVVEERPPVGYVIQVYNLSPVFAFLLPFLGMVGTGLLLRRFASRPLLSGTEEVLEHYHEEQVPMGSREGLVKYLGAILTIGLGGSAGLEGPSINAGGVIGSWVWRKFGGRLDLDEKDLRIMLLCGASAGIAAIFKAPLTGVVFALEVPYKDDIARRAFLPAIISGVVSYVAFASIAGFQPLFSFPSSASFGLVALGLAVLLGLIVAGVAVGFTFAYHALERLYEHSRVSVLMRFAIGGTAIGVVALALRLYSTAPYTYGAGYYLIQGSLIGSFSLQFLAAILALRLLTTIFTLGSGGVGGIFFPQVLFGAMIGSGFALLTHSDVSVYASVGIAAFMSAAYKTPLAAVTFVGDTTGSVSYLVPAMIGSAVAYIVTGQNSVSNHQKLWEETGNTKPE
jgi:chloride channel protein, CIC family